MKLTLLLIGIMGMVYAQGVQDVMNALMLARTTSTTILSITATQGDGGTLKLNKNSGSTISLTTTWTSATGLIADQSSVLKASGSATLTKMVLWGDITCLIGINPTSSPVAMGSISNIPANGVGWSCSTNITGGTQTTPVSGTAVWP